MFLEDVASVLGRLLHTRCHVVLKPGLVPSFLVLGARRAHPQGPGTHQRPQQNHSSHCVCLNVAVDSFCGGTGGRSGEPCPTKLPHPISRNIPTFACAWIPAGTALLGIISLTCISCHARPFPVSGPAEQDPYPNVLISFCFAGMLFLVSGVPLAPKFHSFFMHIWFRGSALASSERVRSSLQVRGSEGGAMKL